MKFRTTGTYALIAVGAVLALVVCIFRGAAVEAVYPIEHAVQVLSGAVGSRVAGAFAGAAASAENERLRSEVAGLRLVRDDLVRLEAENARLRRALDYVAQAPETWLAAAVLVRGGGSSGGRELIRVDKGSLAGVREGAIVTVPEGLVGWVESVTPHTSSIRLITDPELLVGCEVRLPGGDFLRGVLTGGTDERLTLARILSAAEVPPRSLVLTSGLGGVYPKGIVVGTLLRIRQDPDSPRRVGEVLPAVDFATLKDVFIRRAK